MLLTRAPGVEEHHQSSQISCFTMCHCRQGVFPHRSVSWWGHRESYNAPLQDSTPVNLILPYCLGITGIFGRRVTKLRTCSMSFWWSRTWSKEEVGKSTCYISGINQFYFVVFFKKLYLTSLLPPGHWGLWLGNGC